MDGLSAEDRPLDGKDWKEYVRFAQEIATHKLQVEDHVERMIYRRLETPAEQWA